MTKSQKAGDKTLNYASISRSEVPHGRNGKHHDTIERILSDLQQLEPGRAMKIGLEELPDSKENVRSALSRKTRSLGIQVATSSDESYLYVWRNGEGGSE